MPVEGHGAREGRGGSPARATKKTRIPATKARKNPGRQKVAKRTFSGVKKSLARQISGKQLQGPMGFSFRVEGRGSFFFNVIGTSGSRRLPFGMLGATAQLSRFGLGMRVHLPAVVERMAFGARLNDSICKPGQFHPIPRQSWKFGLLQISNSEPNEPNTDEAEDQGNQANSVRTSITVRPS